MLKLFVPVLISLTLSMIYCMKFNKSQTITKLMIAGSVINVVSLLLGTVWFWSTVSDGLAQLVQGAIYGVSFFCLLFLNLITVLMMKKNYRQ